MSCSICDNYERWIDRLRNGPPRLSSAEREELASQLERDLERHIDAVAEASLR